MKPTPLFTEHRHLTDEGIALYVDALRWERVENLPDDMRIHVEKCERCQQQIVESHELMKAIPVDRSIRHPFFDSRMREPIVRYTPYRIAAVFAIAALLGGLYFVIINREGDSGRMTAEQRTEQQNPHVQRDSATVPENTDRNIDQTPLLADNFDISPNLEDLVETEFRSVSIDVITPANGDVVQTPVRFAWKNSDGAMTLKVLTNKELTVIKTTVSGNSYTVNKKLAPGLYYWKLETKKELAYVGKFYIK